MNLKTLARLAAPVILTVGLIAGLAPAAHADPGNPYIAQPGVPFTGGCYFQAGWDTYTPPSGTFGAYIPAGRSTCNSVWQFKMLCGVYPYTNTYVWLVSPIYSAPNIASPQQYVIGNPYPYTVQGASCVPGARIMNAVFVVATGPYTVTCSNANSPYYWFVFQRTDTDQCRFN